MKIALAALGVLFGVIETVTYGKDFVEGIKEKVSSKDKKNKK